MAELKNEFSWSNSRENIFKECRRKYFYHYYGSWGGWQITSPQETRDAYVLKQLKNRFMWAGQVVHETVAEVLKNLKRGHRIDRGTLVPLVKSRMRSEWQNSRDRRYWVDPKSCGLLEHEYDGNIAKEKWQELWDQVELCVSNFFASPILARIEEAGPASWKSIEEFKFFYSGDIKVHAVLDFAFTDQDGKLIIVDWKTGKNLDSGNPWQLPIYGLFVKYEWDAQPAMVRAIEYNLVHNQGQESPLSEEKMKATTEHIKESAAGMLELLSNPKTNTAIKDKFPMTDNRSLCQHCNFKRLCFPQDYAQSYTL